MLTDTLKRKTTFAVTTTALTTLGFAFVTTAQLADGQETDTIDPAPVVQDTAFLSADLNADGELDREEFVSYAVMKADEGKADYSETREKGTYDDLFDLQDSNVDGALSPEELVASNIESGTIEDQVDWSLDESPKQVEPAEDAPAETELSEPEM